MPKISELPVGTAPSGAEKIAAVQNGVTVRLTVSQLNGSVLTFATMAEAVAASISASDVELLGYLAAGDGGRGRYKPSVAPAGNGKFQSADGAWWLLDEILPNELMFGAVATATNAAQTAAIQALLDYCSTYQRKAHIVAAHTTTATISVPAGIEVEWCSGNDVVGVTGKLIKGFNGNMMTVAATGTVLRNVFLNGQGASFTGGGIVWTGNYGRVYTATIIDNDGAGLDFPTGESGTQFVMYDGVFTSHSVGQANITLPVTELTTTGYRRFFNCISGDGGTLFKFNNGNLTQVFGGASGLLDYSATSTGRVSVMNHRAGGAVTLYGIEGHFSGNTCGTSLTIGLGTTFYEVSNNIVAGGLAVVDNSGQVNNRISATLAGSEEFTNKTLNAAVGKGTWTVSGTWTLPSVTLGGTTTFTGQTNWSAAANIGVQMSNPTGPLIQTVMSWNGVNGGYFQLNDTSGVLGVLFSGAIDSYVLKGLGVGTATAPGTGNLKVAGHIQTKAPVTSATDYTMLATDCSLIFTNAGGTSTLTLLSAASYVGRDLWLKTTEAQQVVSATSNVVPKPGGAAGTGILGAVDGAWAYLKSDGTNWVIMASGT